MPNIEHCPTCGGETVTLSGGEHVTLDGAKAAEIKRLRATVLAVRDGLNSGAVDEYDAERMLDRALNAQ